ncbi:MAG: cytochrome b/b6 domain-containing protein [Oceanospirillaceae bacterium]|nr:cytochrome b/b6 domain-containing protein [Oceanospirillaceae bacterium]
MKNYHPLLVTLHWLLAVMILVGLVMGGSVLSATANSNPDKIFFLKMHMSAGLVILIFMLIRLGVRFATKSPPPADIGNNLLNKLGAITHYLLYLIVILMSASGLAIAASAGLFEIVFGTSSAILPVNFDEFPPRAAHGIISKILMLLIAGHIGAFLYHQYIRKDKLLSRMWFGKRM